MVWMQHAARRIDMLDGRPPTRRGLTRFIAPVLFSLSLWAIVLWGLWLIVDRL